MTKHKRAGASRRLLGHKPSGELDVSTWTVVDEGALSPDRRVLFLKRKAAILLYLEGESEQAIRSTTGYSLSQAYRLLTERCLAAHKDGNLWGWRGAVPHLRVYNFA
jgi:hypothetical protein